MNLDKFCLNLKNKITHAYDNSGDYHLGWRLLYSPCSVLNDARIAFVGLNPAGRKAHCQFAMQCGSAYVEEVWGENPRGKSPLQIQVRSLFEKLSVTPEDVLAGNLIPFRSGRWKELKDKKHARQLGKEIWKDIFHRSSPDLIITMGSETWKIVYEILSFPPFQEIQKIRVCWGKVSARKAHSGKCTLVGLPHLSRFRIIGRPKSQSALEQLFGSYYKNG